jgi:hypothetical protein
MIVLVKDQLGENTSTRELVWLARSSVEDSDLHGWTSPEVGALEGMMSVTLEVTAFSKFPTLAAACAGHILIRMPREQRDQFVENATGLGVDLSRLSSSIVHKGPVDVFITRDRHWYVAGHWDADSPITVRTHIKIARKTIGWKLTRPTDDGIQQWWHIRLHQARLM